ncbi:sugar transport protein 8-like [Dioscorea cayenensis subsp. rotundata]|uniref:Sugar transport protein 8-like n=1 Tax=Dioscorea cayennensis subsp. rotundata TaxID=55577 RepID=A0AB40CNL9_DIOCR|nr:sugar transport protein 8-like [Dioscorea cayenensis subsp. rotundata]
MVFAIVSSSARGGYRVIIVFLFFTSLFKRGRLGIGIPMKSSSSNFNASSVPGLQKDDKAHNVVVHVGAKVVDHVQKSSLHNEMHHTIIGGILVATLHDNNTLGKGMAVGVVLLVCLFLSGFAWSWGPLGWLIPSETFPLETRTAGYAFAVSSNMLFTFLIAQAFLSMLCQMKSGIFFFAGWIIIMALFIKFMLPETKGIPIEEMTERVWKNHWYWKRFMVEDECELSKMEKGISP